MRVVRKLFSQIGLIVNTDRVIALMPIAAGGTFHSLRGSVLLQQHDVSKAFISMYPARVYAAQMVEIDDLVADWDTLWDQYIPKDEDTSEVAATIGVDVSRDTTDVTVFEEPGEASPNELFSMREPTQRLWKRDEFLSLVSSPHAYEGAAVDTFTMGERYSVDVNERIHFPTGGFVALGIASPNWDDVATPVPNAMANIGDVLIYENLPDFLHVARLALLGATEAGAETPFVDVLSLIEELTEPTVFEQTAGTFVNPTMQVISRMIFDVEVRNPQAIGVLSSG